MKQKFVSTRGYAGGETFLDAVRIGLAPDGGLFVPADFGKFEVGELAKLEGKSFIEIVAATLGKFPLGELQKDELQTILAQAYGDNFADPAIAPIREIGDGQYLLELFHGPTASFKDLALQLTPQLFARATIERDEDYLVLAATSGDTGVATMAGYAAIPGVKVLVLYPRDGVSSVQEQQMLAHQSETVRAAAVSADFDFCQSAVKQLFADREFQKELDNTKLSSANSINWGRLLPQVGYWVAAYLQMVRDKKVQLGDPIDIVVPCGNFGNILSAYFAKQLGLPFARFVVASNENNILADWVETGVMDTRERQLQLTTSPSIDILRSSNTERMLYLLSNGDTERVRAAHTELVETGKFVLTDAEKEQLQSEFQSGWCSESECLATVRQTLEKSNYLLDTHTAVAVKVANTAKGKNPQLIAATAHWAKFPAAVLEALGGDAAGQSTSELYSEIQQLAPTATMHARLAELLESKPEAALQLPADLEVIKQSIREFTE